MTSVHYRCAFCGGGILRLLGMQPGQMWFRCECGRCFWSVRDEHGSRWYGKDREEDPDWTELAIAWWPR